MGKHFPLDAEFEFLPTSIKNMELALVRIGEIDPLKIIRTTLIPLPHIKQKDLTTSDFFNRGVLNVRKYLNRNLGRQGKYSNNMIINSSKISSRSKNTSYILNFKVPGKSFLKIVCATFFILWNHDRDYCSELLQLKRKDEPFITWPLKNSAFNIISPIQISIISSGNIQFNHPSLKYLHNYVLEKIV